jgi:hypothetical protein
MLATAPPKALPFLVQWLMDDVREKNVAMLIAFPAPWSAFS